MAFSTASPYSGVWTEAEPCVAADPAAKPAGQLNAVVRRQRAHGVVKLFVRVNGPRPDFRLVLAFVWGDADTDTDGNSRNPASREWTELYAQNRGRPDEVFNVFPASADPLVLQVQSEKEWLAAVVVHLLAEATGGGVSESDCGPFEPAASVLPRVGGFDVPAAWERFRASPYQRTTLDDPYPNLRV